MDWQPIETAPTQEEVQFLAATLWGGGVCSMNVVEYAYEDQDGLPLYRVMGLPAYRPTHWMPLPTPPSQEGTG